MGRLRPAPRSATGHPRPGLNTTRGARQAQHHDPSETSRRTRRKAQSPAAHRARRGGDRRLGRHRRRAGLRHRHRQRGSQRALGQHRSLQPRVARQGSGRRHPQERERRRRRPQFRQGLAGHQPAGRAVRIRSRLAAQVRHPSQRCRLVRPGLFQPGQHEYRDRQYAGQRPAGGGRAQPVYEALCEGRIGRDARLVRLRQFRRRRHAGQRPAGPAHRLLGREPAAQRPGPRHRLFTELGRLLEAAGHAGQRGQGIHPPARRPHDPGAADAGPVAGRAVVLQLAGRALARVGQLPGGRRLSGLRRRLVHHRAEPVRCRDPRRARRPAAVERAGGAEIAQQRQPG